jgi:hypothetical protein
LSAIKGNSNLCTYNGYVDRGQDKERKKERYEYVVEKVNKLYRYTGSPSSVWRGVEGLGE